MSRDVDWALAFARQAQADFEMFLALSRSREPIVECHKLQFLQMACEKLVKSHLKLEGAAYELTMKHTVVKKHLLKVLLPSLIAAEPSHAHRALTARFRQLAGEVELLSPTADHGGTRRDNCEYPWDAGIGKILIPATFDFPLTQLLIAKGGVPFLKALSNAVHAQVADLSPIGS